MRRHSLALPATTVPEAERVGGQVCAVRQCGEQSLVLRYLPIYMEIASAKTASQRHICN